ncbi:MAG: right-handed parallel beta-helix repeat-containing protein [Verrucomicrobiales bacterium]|nr:right-handed parallel beta-helix repeat-containing protein [Verrucomicrobiales bacterium]
MRNLFLLTAAIAMVSSGTSSATTFYVSPSGDDANPGTSDDAPFQVVQHAVDQMQPGDTLIVKDGTYTGILKLKDGITIAAENPRKAIFSGAEVLQGSFQKHAENIYKIEVSKEPKQLFYQNEPMSWARWPNLKWSENWIRPKKWLNGAASPGQLKYGGFSNIKDLDLTGGYCFLRYSKGNSCYSRAIESFDGTTLKWDDTNFYNRLFTGEDGKHGAPREFTGNKKSVRGMFFLAGALDLLDTDGEWFAKDNLLYVYSSGDEAPNPSDFLIKTNDYSVHETEAISDVSIKGIDFFATSVKLGNLANKNISFNNSYFTYIGAELLFTDRLSGKRNSKPILVNGNGITFTQCLFAGAHNTALHLSGTDVAVGDCVFAENNRHANFESTALFLSARGRFIITRNTLFNNCSDAIRIGFSKEYVSSTNPQVSYNNIFNAGIFNSDVSGVYFPNMTQHYTEFHHNWVHNVKGNGVRLDQAGEEFSVHHNVFWSSKRGMSIEGYGKFNVYNNTSARNRETCDLIRNVVEKKKGSNPAMVSNDTTFPPITDWNVLNNLVEKFADGVGPSEVGPFSKSATEGTLHPARAKRKSLPINDRGSIQGNLTGPKVFNKTNLAKLNLVPPPEVIENGVPPTEELIAQGVTSLGSYRGAYSRNEKAWNSGSNWLPFQLEVPQTMVESDRFAKKYSSTSIVPEIIATGLPSGTLSPKGFTEAPSVPKAQTPPKTKNKGKPAKGNKL